MNTQSRLQALNHAVNRWLELPKATRATVCQAVVEATSRAGLVDVLGAEGIAFAQTDDVFNDMRVNAQKIFRWLGHYDGINTAPERLWFVEQAIVAAMPEQIRISYLSEVYSAADIYICLRVESNNNQVDLARMASLLTRENAEAQISVIEIADSGDREALLKAKKEMSEAIAVNQSALDHINSLLKVQPLSTTESVKSHQH